jgi:hypothetical protein
MLESIHSGFDEREGDCSFASSVSWDPRRRTVCGVRALPSLYDTRPPSESKHLRSFIANKVLNVKKNKLERWMEAKALLESKSCNKPLRLQSNSIESVPPFQIRWTTTYWCIIQTFTNAEEENRCKIHTEIKNRTLPGNIFTSAGIKKKGKKRRQKQRQKERIRLLLDLLHVPSQVVSGICQ